LLDALRTRANLTGNKRGCDRGACGACTMIVDGRTVYACSTLAIEVQGKKIRTVDGLASGGLLEKHPNATPEQIKKGLDGNICRCGTFSRVFEAVASLSSRGTRTSAGEPDGADAPLTEEVHRG